MRNQNAGLTLVEVLAVVVLLGLLAATLAVSLSGSIGKAKHELAKTGMGQIVQKLEVYRLEVGQWPPHETGLLALSEGLASPADAFFLESDKLKDPWGRLYHYVTPGPDEHPYEIVTYGADGQAGGVGEDADLSSAHLRGEE